MGVIYLLYMVPIIYFESVYVALSSEIFTNCMLVCPQLRNYSSESSSTEDAKASK